MKKPTAYFPHPNKAFTSLTIWYWIAVAAAFFLWSRDWGIVRATSTSQEHLFGLFGFCVFSVMAYLAYGQFKAQPTNNLRSGLLIGIPVLVSLFFVALTVELSQKSWDYEQYETAFRAIAINENPYLSTRYLYPPFFAQVMVFFYNVGKWIFPLLGMALKESSLWMFVFYIHQSTLLFALLSAYYLSLRFAELLGLKPLKGILFVSGLFLFNVPLLRTIIYNQVNFYILVSILLTITILARRPFISGIAIAVGGLIKLYPFALVAPLVVTKKWKVLAGVLVGAAGIVAVQNGFFRDLTLWKQFILFYTSFPMERESAWFRNSSILSFMRNSLDFIGAPAGWLTPIFGLAALIILGWIGLRFIQRERLYASSNKADSTLTADTTSHRNIGHLIDFSVISLLIAPSAWEHHYVIAIPLAIWAFALSGRKVPWLLTIGLISVFLLPTFNVYPFSYLRMAGVILLLVLTSPNKTHLS